MKTVIEMAEACGIPEFENNESQAENIMRFAELVRADERARMAEQPVVLKWQRVPIRTAWGDDMVVASVAIDKDHTVDLYCERDQAPKVDAMFAQRTWVGLTDEELREFDVDPIEAKLMIAKLRSKNEDRN